MELIGATYYGRAGEQLTHGAHVLVVVRGSYGEIARTRRVFRRVVGPGAHMVSDPVLQVRHWKKMIRRGSQGHQLAQGRLDKIPGRLFTCGFRVPDEGTGPLITWAKGMALLERLTN